MKRHLVLVRGGIGHQAQALPAVSALRRRLPEGATVDVLNTGGWGAQATPLLFRSVADLASPGVSPRRSLDQYEGQYLTFAARDPLPGLAVLGRATHDPKRSEVGNNMELTRAPGGVLRVGERRVDGELDWVKPLPAPDVLICAGHGRQYWEARAYEHYPELIADLLADNISVGCVGLPSEHLAGAEDLTGASLEQTFRLLRGCKVLVSNAAGLYHVAAALGVPTVVVFTFTSPAQDYDLYFHHSARIVSPPRSLTCAPCQFRQPRPFWEKNKDRCRWECRRIVPASHVREHVDQLLQGGARVN